METKPDWVCVIDKDEASEKQKKIITNLKPKTTILGLIECHKDENASSQTCHSVEYFPAFCNQVSKMCVYGLRETERDFEELSKMSQK